MEDSVRQGNTFHLKILDESSASLGHQARLQHRLSPLVRWSNRKSQQSPRGFIESLCVDLWQSWEFSLPYIEFSYNNSYQTSIKMSPFEALYGRKCQTPLMWSNVGEKTLEGPAFIKEAEEKVALIRKRLLEAQSRQKSYTDNWRRELSFEEGDFV
jgi:hypothetical protein